MADEQTINRQLTTLEQKLDKQIRKSNTIQRTTLIVGLILIAIIIGYFSWAGYYTREMMQPKDLASMASGQIVEYVKEYRPIAEREAQANAGPLVDRLVDEVLEKQLPEGRKFLEAYAREETDRSLNRMTEYLLESLETSLEANKGQIQGMTETLDTNEGREEFRASLTSILSESITDEEIIRQLDEYAFALRELEGTLSRITTGGENLSSSEKATYDLVAAVLELAERNITGFDFMDGQTFEGLEEALVSEDPIL